ncbi:DUF1003 domain-containing protein [uncultured Micrococcus sp.]|uniref:DUF1003 domain-containing protein n=1 Tax=uncultured Micrococcus sp. TaxID=114051 RepID=UPI00130D75F6|nr:DUF1003 domain-containing protein [uncultured Micrococcus sp.]
MAEHTKDARDSRPGLDTPLSARSRRMPRLSPNPDAFGEATEGFARFMGTPQFLLWMTMFCALWIGWNTFGPEPLRFDSAALGYTALTLVLSLQASYAAPLLLLAQNRQDDRDKVALREDRDRAERNLADTEYLTREIAGLRIALQDVSTRDFVRSELRSSTEDLVAELRESLREEIRAEVRADLLRDQAPRKKSKKKKRDSPARAQGDAEPQTTTLAIIAAQERQDGAPNTSAEYSPSTQQVRDEH